jgi:hypothetical protein
MPSCNEYNHAMELNINDLVARFFEVLDTVLDSIPPSFEEYESAATLVAQIKAMTTANLTRIDLGLMTDEDLTKEIHQAAQTALTTFHASRPKPLPN